MTSAVAAPIDPVPAPVRTLAALFADALAHVAFPDVDAASLTAGVARVDAHQASVARLEEELAAARAALDASREELLRLAARAHAYARVYTEDDEALRARVDDIALPRAKATRVVAKPPAPAEAPAEAPARKKRVKGASDEPALFTGAPIPKEDDEARAA